MADPAIEAGLPHAAHDPLLIAAVVARDATDPDRQHAETLASTCTECAELAADLRAIARATATLPTTERRRDFRISPADAERLRPGGLRGLAGAFGRLRLPRSQPFAAGLTMLGVSGLLVTSLSFGGGAPTTAVDSAAGAPSDVRVLEVPVNTTPGDLELQGGGPQVPTERDVNKQNVQLAPAPQPAAPDAPRLAVAAGSAVAAFTGIGLFLAGRQRRRPR